MAESMKVYVALAGEYEERYVEGVFATEEGAKAALRENPDWQKRESERLELLARDKRTVSGRPDPCIQEPWFNIEEHEVE